MSKIIVADICSLTVDNQSTGHYFAVAQNYLDMFGDLEQVKVAGGPIYEQKFRDKVLRLPYKHVAGESKLQEKWHELMNCRALCRQMERGDILIMQSVALVTAFVGIILFMHKSCRLFFIQYNTESINTLLKKILWKIASHKVNGIIATFSDVAKEYGKPYIVVPDYVYARNQHQSYLKFSERKYDVCMLGHIYHDKGVLEALEYLMGKGLRIIVAGKIGEPDIEPKIRSLALQDSNIQLRIGYLQEREYQTLMASSKYCMLNYRGRYNEHSSGVVYDALFHCTPVLVTDTKSTEIVRKFGMGVAFGNVVELNIDRLLDERNYAGYQKCIKNYLLEQQKTIMQLLDFLKQA